MITRAEWRWAAVFALIVMVATTVPYLAAARSQHDGWEFGGFLIGIDDGNTYLAKMRQGAEGELLNILSHTTEPQTAVFIYPILHLLGWMAGSEPAALIVAYHSARVAAGAALLLVSYAFLARLVPGVTARRFGLVLVGLGGGLGWFVTLTVPGKLLGSLPLDFILPEAFSFLTLFGLMHLALGRALLLLALMAYLDERGLWAGLLLLGVGLAQPMYMVVGWGVMGMHVAVGWAVRWFRKARANPAGTRDDWRTAAAAIAISAPLVTYNVVALGFDPVLAQWMRQNRLPSPNPVHYLLAFGVLLIPAVGGWRVLWRREARLALLAGGWVVLAVLMAYAPIPTQRRLVEGIQLPLVGLAVLGLQALARSWRRAAALAVLSLTIPTTILIYLGALSAARHVAEPAFHPLDQLAAFDWLRLNGQPGDAALSAYDTGNVLPVFTPLLAYVGHGPETIFIQDKLPRVRAFYDADTPDIERLRLLEDGGIDYVIIGPHEAALGSFNPSAAAYLSRQYQAGRYAVYAVVR